MTTARPPLWRASKGDYPARPRVLMLLLFALFGSAYALFTQDSVSHNTLCRAVMTANLVQHGRVDINGFEHLTDDKAFRAGNYYCDKAPGMSFLAIPTAWLFTRLFPITIDTPYGRVWSAFLYLCALTTSGLLSALAAVAVFQHILARVGDMHAAMVSSLAFGLGGPIWGWATSFFSHSAAGALLVLGFIALDKLGRKLEAGEPMVPLGIFTGLLLGTAVAVEYTAVVPAAILGAAFVLSHVRKHAAGVLRACAASAAGGVVALIPVLIFHAAAFGSPITTGYAFTVVFQGHASGFFGVNAPSPEVLGKLLVSADRGAIWFAPIVLASAWAVAMLMRQKEHRPTAIVTTLVAVWYLLMNAGFEYWHGGASTGPRYLTPALGFSALALGLAWPQFTTWQRRSAIAVLAASILINFACTAVDMTAGGLVDQILPSFLSADLRQTLTYKVLERPALLHFVPPLAVACALSALIARQMRSIATPAPGTRKLAP